MKKIITIIIVCICVHSGYSQEKSGELYYDGNKIIFHDTIQSCKEPFLLCVKKRLNRYANSFNTNVSLEKNKMQDYIFYEDSITIAANVRFVVKHSVEYLLWNMEVTFEKHGTEVYVKADNIILIRISNTLVGVSDSNTKLEDFDSEKTTKVVKKIKLEIETLLNKLKE